MKVVVAKDVPYAEQNPRRPGKTIQQFLLAEDAPDGLNFSLRRVQFQPGEAALRTPRHRHLFQQIRWSEADSYNFAPGQDIPEGDLAYFPKGAWYGPQHEDSATGFALQYGFNGEYQESGEAWAAHRKVAMEQMNARGKFEDGVYKLNDPGPDEIAERDSVHAIYQETYRVATGKTFPTPTEGYETPILVHPAAFAYYKASDGVEVKRLGNFFDNAGPRADVRLLMTHLNDGGVYTLDGERAQIGWTKEPGLVVDGQEYPELTCFYSPLGEQSQIGASGDVEVNIVEFPRLD